MYYLGVATLKFWNNKIIEIKKCFINLDSHSSCPVGLEEVKKSNKYHHAKMQAF